MPEVLRPYEAEIREQAERPGEILAQAALLWRVLYNAVDGYRERHPDWAFVRHEDASAEPVATFERLYAQLDLDFTRRRARGDRAGERARQPGRAGDAACGRAATARRASGAGATT